MMPGPELQFGDHAALERCASIQDLVPKIQRLMGCER